MFDQADEAELLKLKGVGPTLLARFRQMGLDNIHALAEADVEDILLQGAAITGSSCWKNSPQARSTVTAAVEWANGAIEPDIGHQDRHPGKI